MYSIPYHSTDLSQSSFLVTGGAGFIGSNIVEYLLKYGARKVRVLDNFSTGFRSNTDLFKNNSSFELIEGDIRDLGTCKRAVLGMDYVSHQAALGSVPRSINDPITTNEVNVSGFLNVLVAVRDERTVKRMAYAASSSTYGDSSVLPKLEGSEGAPLSPYAITKLVDELYGDVFSKVYNVNTVGLRYFNIFGPRQDPYGAYAAVIPLFIDAALNKKTPVIFGDGETSRDFTFVENAVQANIKVLLETTRLTKHEVVNIACGESITLNELWVMISSLAGFNRPPHYCQERPGDIKHSRADIRKAESLFGYAPKWKIQKGLRQTFEHYQREICR